MNYFGRLGAAMIVGAATLGGLEVEASAVPIVHSDVNARLGKDVDPFHPDSEINVKYKISNNVSFVGNPSGSPAGYSAIVGSDEIRFIDSSPKFSDKIDSDKESVGFISELVKTGHDDLYVDYQTENNLTHLKKHDFEDFKLFSNESEVPEPYSATILGLGAGLLICRRPRKHSNK